jgi:hypothetical protein
LNFLASTSLTHASSPSSPAAALKSTTSPLSPFIDPTNAANFLSPSPSSSSSLRPSNHMRLLVNDSSMIVYHNTMFMWSPQDWSHLSVDSLSLLEIINPKPGMILFGSGRRTQRITPEIEKYLKGKNIKWEVMDTVRRKHEIEEWRRRTYQHTRFNLHFPHSHRLIFSLPLSHFFFFLFLG